jgi:hypothetical protein
MGSVFWRGIKMNCKEVIYPLLTDYIDDLLTALTNWLNDNSDDSLEQVHDLLTESLDLITNVYTDDVGGPCLGEVKVKLEEIDFGDFPIEGWGKFKIFLTLTKIIEGDGSFDLSDSIGFDKDDFVVSEYQGNDFPVSALGFLNNTEVKDSMAYLNLNSQELVIDIGSSDFTNGLLTLFLYILSNKNDLDETGSYILYRSDSLNSVAACSALKMHAVLKGNVVHIEKSVVRLPILVPLLDRVSSMHPYGQFEETLVILSEFNNSNDVIRSFLALYHILESFMYKVPVVNLGANNNGNIFSLRDFRRLYDNVSGKERDALKNLFSKPEMGQIWERNINGDKFKNIVSANVLSLENNGFVSADCSHFLDKLNSGNLKSHDELNNNLTAKSYSQFIYDVRCSIVHNKETEFHLSYFNLDNTISALLNSVLISPLFMLIADLLTDVNSKVWYSGPALNLYKT